MPGKPWIGSPTCRSHAHCTLCRQRRDFRQRIMETWDLPGVDFDCPEGFTAEKLPPAPEAALFADTARMPRQGLGATVARLSRAAEIGLSKPCPECRERREELNRLWPNRKKE